MEDFSAVFGGKCTGIVLSSYGNDVVLGSKLIVIRGGEIIVQNPGANSLSCSEYKP